MKKFLLHILVILGVSFGVANLIGVGSLWALRNSDFYKPSFLSNAIEENKFDYIILGASTGLTTLDTKAIDAEAGITGINLSMDDTGIASAVLMLKHFIAEGKSTKMVVLAPSVETYHKSETSVSDNDYRFLMYVHRDYVGSYYNSVKVPNTMSNTMAASQVFPALGVSYFNAEILYPSLLSLTQPERRNRFDARGNYTYPVLQKRHKSVQKEPMTLNFTNNHLQELEQLCAANDIRLIYYLSPMQHKKVVFESSDIEVIDHSDLIQDERQFYDKIHVNTLGRSITSRKFAETMTQMLSLTPSKTLPKN